MKEKDLYKVDVLGFSSKIGYITNLGTTFYEMQSQYPKESKEYEVLNNRLKFLCCAQNMEIDHAKGIITQPLPKCWTQYQKINEDDSEEEKARKEFENKLVVEKRPEFMRFLYSHYNKEYKSFQNDFDRYCLVKFGKTIKELTDKDKKKPEVQEMLAYYNRKNPLLETNGVMNRLSRYMQKEMKGIKSFKTHCDNDLIYNKLFNTNISIDNELLDKIREVWQEYNDFKKSKQLSTSEFSTYEQYYKSLRNYCLENLSSDIRELANIAVSLCYKENPSKPKDFCWDVFGAGIVENLKETHEKANVPYLSFDGNIEYLGNYYTMGEVDLHSLGDTMDDSDIFADLDCEDSDEDIFDLEA